MTARALHKLEVTAAQLFVRIAKGGGELRMWATSDGEVAFCWVTPSGSVVGGWETFDGYCWVCACGRNDVANHPRRSLRSQRASWAAAAAEHAIGRI